MTFAEVADAVKFSTHVLYYNVDNMSAGEDLAALVRSVFVLTQCTFYPVETFADLDYHMRLQWSWGGDALDAAQSCDYKAVERFLSTGSAASETPRMPYTIVYWASRGLRLAHGLENSMRGSATT